MKAAVIIFSIGLIALGMWIMGNSVFVDLKPAESKAPAQSLRTNAQPQASPVLLGFALTAGGVLLLFLASKRK